MKISLVSFLVILGIGSLAACNTPLVTGRDIAMKPVYKTFSSPVVATFEAAEKALNDMDYKVEYADKDQGVLRTGWMPTTADSHYLDLFDYKDYGVTGSYYHLTVRITEDGPSKSIVEVQAPLRTIVTRMKSSYRQEKKFLARVRNYLRPADIEVTNIGVVEREPVEVRP